MSRKVRLEVTAAGRGGAPAGPVTTLLNGDARVEVREGYVFFWHARPAANVEEWATLQAALDEALPTRNRRLMIDSRASAYTPSEVQSAIWAWLESSGLARVATLVESPSLAVSLRMQSIAKGVALKAFADEDEAAAWLLET